MTNLRHYDGLGAARFITFSCHRRLKLLTDPFAADAVASRLLAARAKFGFDLLAYVIMPNHVHLVINPRDGTKAGAVIGHVKFTSAHRILSKWKATHHPLLPALRVERDGELRLAFWQRRCYDHNCRTEASVMEKIEYCHNNPVKWGLVDDPSAWKWSSFQWYCG